jgi:hypothetical protein
MRLYYIRRQTANRISNSPRLCGYCGPHWALKSKNISSNNIHKVKGQLI